MSKGILYVLSGPSGSGKGTIVKELLKINKDVKLSVSATTREPRAGETNEYFFISRDEFESRINQGLMLEYTEYCGNYYGTPASPVFEWLEQGFDVILEIEVEGAAQVKKKYPQAVLIFVIPPSLNELKNRLVGRATESDEIIKKRLKQAENELARSKDYDYMIVNDTVESAAQRLMTIFSAEKLKTKYILNKLEVLCND